MSTSQDFKTTFKYNLTCIFLSLRAQLKKPLCPRTPCTCRPAVYSKTVSYRSLREYQRILYRFLCLIIEGRLGINATRYECASVSIRYRTLFSYKPDPMPNFSKHTLMSKIQTLSLFKGLRSRKEKMTTTPSFFGQKLM